jgi:hypothetical protein
VTRRAKRNREGLCSTSNESESTMQLSFLAMCEFATLVDVTPGIGAQMLLSEKMWLEFRQQTAMGLSIGCRNFGCRTASPEQAAKM